MKFLTLLLLFSGFSFASSEIINRNWYTLNYNEDHEVANWVSYTLEKSQLKNCVQRASSFKSDPLVSTGSAELIDYKNSGYDRGHLLPAGDMKFEAGAMRDAFYLSNITPQPSKFNQGRWSQLETLIRAWAKQYGKLWIVTGPVLKKNLEWIGVNNEVSVPEEYFKVILRKERTGYIGIAFLMSTDVPYSELSAYVLDIDKIEDITGHDFFAFLTSSEARQVEGKVDAMLWNFTARFDYLPCGTSVAP
jgi:endonuclease G, mitochondrial